MLMRSSGTRVFGGPAGRARLGATVAFAALAIAVAVSNPDKPPERRLAGGTGFEPLPGGELMSDSEAADVLPFDLHLPDTAKDNDETIDELWVRADDSPAAYVIYDSGLIASIEPAKAFPITLEEWYKRQVDDGVPSSLEELNGVQAYVVEATDGATGSVKMFVKGTVITVIGNGIYNDDELRATAASLLP